jgi:Mce-associated membrane protein
MTERPVGVPRRGLALPFVVVVLVVVLAVSTTFLVFKVQDVSHSNSQTHERTHVAAIAGQYAVDFTAIDYRKFDAERDAAAKNATSAFATEYLATMKDLRPIFTKGQVVQTTSVQHSAVLSLSGSEAVVLVALSGTATSVRSTTPTIPEYRMQITLTKVDGNWLTSKVVQL